MDQSLCKYIMGIAMLMPEHQILAMENISGLVVTGCRPKEPVKAWNLDWYMGPVCHLLRQSAKVFTCSGMCVALSMMLLTASVSHSSRRQACKKLFLLCMELIMSTQAWLSQWILIHLPCNLICQCLTTTTTVRSSN